MDHVAPSTTPSSSTASSSEWELVHDSPPNKQNITTPTINFHVDARPATSEPIMPGWKDDYLSALLEAERSNPISFELVEACSHLNDRIAILEAEKAQTQHQSTPTKPSPNPPPEDTTTTTPLSPHHARTRADLAVTLTQKAHLESRLRATVHDRDRLLSISRSQQVSIGTLTAERDALARKVRDQASELRGKNDLLQRVQDDLVALEIERNMAEKSVARLKEENKDLVERWMARMAGEANAMNSRNERGGGGGGGGGA